MMTREKGAQQQHQEQQHQPTKRILVLHGSRQTGDLLLGRMDKLRKRLEKLNYELVAPSAVFAHPENPELRHWWNHVEGTNTYDGLIEQTLPQLQQLWKTTSNCVGLLGFSQGARLAHLLTLLHDRQPSLYLPGLQFTIMVANYDAPLPDGLDAVCSGLSSMSQPQSPKIQIPSLHVWGMSDALISPAQSKAVLAYYESAVPHIHESGQ
jgi:dienelactone hydrolase